jgi:hypothetical protein
MKRTTIMAAVLAALSWAVVAGADVVALVPVRDTTLYEDPAGAYGNGAGDFLFAGSNASGLVRRCVLAFDVAAALPPGSTVDAAELTLTMDRTQGSATEVSLHRLLADWGEGTSDAAFEEGGGAPATAGDATWLHRFYPTILWASPGGDVATTPAATTAVGGTGAYTWGSTPAMVADVQSWLDDPTSSVGWLLAGDEAAAQTAQRFASRSHPDSAVRPVLVVAFTPLVPTVPGVPALSAVGLALSIALVAAAAIRRLATAG